MISTNLEQWPLSGLATAAVVLAALYAAAYQLQRAKSNAREPPIITSYIPLWATSSAWPSKAGGTASR